LSEDVEIIPFMPLTLSWFIALACTLVAALLDRGFGHQDARTKCMSTSHIVFVTCVVCAFVAVGVASKMWIVKKEEAGSGEDGPAARLVSIWDVLGLAQWQIGVAVQVVVLAGCFGKDWYDACLVGEG